MHKEVECYYLFSAKQWHVVSIRSCCHFSMTMLIKLWNKIHGNGFLLTTTMQHNLRIRFIISPEKILPRLFAIAKYDPRDQNIKCEKQPKHKIGLLHSANLNNPDEIYIVVRFFCKFPLKNGRETKKETRKSIVSFFCLFSTLKSIFEISSLPFQSKCIEIAVTVSNALDQRLFSLSHSLCVCVQRTM